MSGSCRRSWLTFNDTLMGELHMYCASSIIIRNAGTKFIHLVIKLYGVKVHCDVSRSFCQLLAQRFRLLNQCVIASPHQPVSNVSLFSVKYIRL